MGFLWIVKLMQEAEDKEIETNNYTAGDKQIAWR